MKITNQALHHVYVLANQHKVKTEEGIFLLQEMFDCIEETVNEFEIQASKMGNEGKALEEKSLNTAFTVEVREKYKAEFAELQSQFEIIHTSFVEIEVSEYIANVMKEILLETITEGKIAGRRMIRNTYEALSAIDEIVVAK